MKWIKDRNNFLIEEAKIRDVILPKQAEAVKRVWGEIWLDLEEIEPTPNIEQGKWKLSEEDKRKVLGTFFQVNIDEVYSIFESLPDKFVETINNSIDISLIRNVDEKLLTGFNIRRPSINQIGILTDPIFRKISVGETKSSEVILRDDTGRPIMDDNGRPKKIQKKEGEVIFSRNLVNINTFVDDFNNCFVDIVDASKFSSGLIPRLVGSSKEDFGGDNYNVDVDVYGKDMYLSIKHNPKDILNISISRFYSSCQHLYSGGYRRQLLSNVFDPNSIPAFLIFDAKIYDKDDNLISEQLPLSRLMIRNFHNIDGKINLYFDRSYPDRMEDIFKEIIEKYTSNKQTEDNIESYLFTPDVPSELEQDINPPYMDRKRLKRGKYIGKNVDKIYLSQQYDWSNTIISPSAKVKEIVIETDDVPSNFFEIPLTPEWIKIRYIHIKDFKPFKKIKTDSFALDKCKFNGKVLKDLLKINPNLKKIQITACDIEKLNIKALNTLEELHLLYTIDPENLIKTLKDIDVKKLVISGDLVSDTKNKDFINSLKRKGIKIEIVGIVL
jgi:hypothetical protein